MWEIQPVYIYVAHAWSFTLDQCMLYLGCRSFGQYRCSNGQCVSYSFRCNGIRNCFDGSDETNCCEFSIYLTVVNCWCYHNHCCQLYLKITRYICTDSCQSGALQCSNGQCISSFERCDGNRNCINGSDETGCGELLKYFNREWGMRIYILWL